MGLAADMFVKNRDMKFWINVVVDAILIGVLLWMSLGARSEYQNGWNDCSAQACGICVLNSSQKAWSNASVVSPFSGSYGGTE